MSGAARASAALTAAALAGVLAVVAFAPPPAPFVAEPPPGSQPSVQPDESPLEEPLETGAVDAGPSAPCGDPRLVGAAEPAPVDPEEPRCGAADTVRLSRIDGVLITPEALTTCRMAEALADWLETGVGPAAVETFGAGVATVVQVSDYSCRTRNSQPGGRLSQHAFANALDVARFELADGTVVSVVDGWPGGGAAAAFLRAAWTSACARFGTVLGPDADAWHRDHFHLDGAERPLAYCR